MKKILAVLIAVAIITMVVKANTGDKNIAEGQWDEDIAMKFSNYTDGVEGGVPVEINKKEYVDGKLIVYYTADNSNQYFQNNKNQKSMVIWYDGNQVKADNYEK